MIRLLLENDDEIRFASATGDTALASAVFSYLIPSRSGQLEPLKVLLSRISYDTLRAHDIFKGRPDLQSVLKNKEQKPNAAKCTETDFSQPELLSDGSASSGAGNAAAIDILSYDVAGTPDYAYSIAVRISTLHELCLRAVGKACLEAAKLICEHGGAIPPQHPWIQVTPTRRMHTFINIYTYIHSILDCSSCLDSAVSTSRSGFASRSVSHRTLSQEQRKTPSRRSFQTLLWRWGCWGGPV